MIRLAPAGALALAAAACLAQSVAPAGRAALAVAVRPRLAGLRSARLDAGCRAGSTPAGKVGEAFRAAPVVARTQVARVERLPASLDAERLAQRVLARLALRVGAVRRLMVRRRDVRLLGQRAAVRQVRLDEVRPGQPA